MKRTDALAALLRADLEGKDILEAACGAAEFAVSATRYAKSVSCVDLDARRLGPLAKEAGVRFQPMDAAQMIYPGGAFDTVVLYNAFFHVKDQWGAIERECRRVLRPGGALYVIGTWKLDTGRMLEAFRERAEWRGPFLIVRLAQADIAFCEIASFPRGTLAALLRDAYSFEPRFERDWRDQWRAFDDFFYDHPRISRTCGFVTALEGRPVGFVTWDPRGLPERVQIGHNCVATAYKGRGWGARQMREAVRRIRETGAERVFVETNAALVPARRMYEAAGLRLVERRAEPLHPEYAGERLRYEAALR